jgi:hypothetical protein
METLGLSFEHTGESQNSELRRGRRDHLAEREYEHHLWEKYEGAGIDLRAVAYLPGIDPKDIKWMTEKELHVYNHLTIQNFIAKTEDDPDDFSWMGDEEEIQLQFLMGKINKDEVVAAMVALKLKKEKGEAEGRAKAESETAGEVLSEGDAPRRRPLGDLFSLEREATKSDSLTGLGLRRHAKAWLRRGPSR